MKLLFDENLSPRLVVRLADIYPECTHVSRVGLARAPDETLWRYARENSLMIVTQDADFGEMSVLIDSPPKVIWIRCGNCSTREIETLFRTRYEDVLAFHNSPHEAVLALF